MSDKTTKWIAFLRAINVGGHTVKMERLRSLFEELEFSAIETFIASGNVIFDAPATAEPTGLEDRIARHLRQALGYEVATFLRTPAELSVIAAHEPFAANARGEDYALSIAFAGAPPTAEAHARLMTYRTEIDDFQIRDREIYWLCRVKVSQSTFSGAALEKALKMPATMRNITTVRKLAAKYSEISSTP